MLAVGAATRAGAVGARGGAMQVSAAVALEVAPGYGSEVSVVVAVAVAAADAKELSAVAVAHALDLPVAVVLTVAHALQVSVAVVVILADATEAVLTPTTTASVRAMNEIVAAAAGKAVVAVQVASAVLSISKLLVI